MWKLIVDLETDTAVFDFNERQEALVFMLDILEHGIRKEKDGGGLVLYPPAAIRMFEIWEEPDEPAAGDLDPSPRQGNEGAT